MPLGDAPGNGKSDAKAAGPGVPGLVRPVEPVKELRQLPRVQAVAAVLRPDNDPPAAFFHREPDSGLRNGVLHGVVQQDGDQLPDGVLVAAVGQARRDGQLQRVAWEAAKSRKDSAASVSASLMGNFSG